MILKTIVIILFFILGIIDKSLGLTILGNSFYIGTLIYLVLLILVKRKADISIIGFAYFVGLSSTFKIIGVVPLIILGLEALYFLGMRLLFASNKATIFIITTVYFGLVFTIVQFIFNDYRIVLNSDFIVVCFAVSLIGGVVSLLSKHHLYER